VTSDVCRDPYRDVDLVRWYDVDNPAGADHAHYRALADEIGARSIVDLGCGTGLLTRSLAASGRTVTGVDPSHAMINYARRQPGADAVTWIHGDAAAIPPTGAVDLVVCTGNAIMHVSPATLPSVLRALAAALRPGGTLSFDSRHPAHREWEQWTPAATYSERTLADGLLREWLDVTEVESGRVVFDAHNVFPDGEERVYTNVLHFRSADQFRRELVEAGFTGITCQGDWHGGSVDGTSRVLVIRACRVA
jgi:SAM-dependent methyltransferase